MGTIAPSVIFSTQDGFVAFVCQDHRTRVTGFVIVTHALAWLEGLLCRSLKGRSIMIDLLGPIHTEIPEFSLVRFVSFLDCKSKTRAG